MSRARETRSTKTLKWILVAWHSALLGYGKDCLVQCQDNVTKWDSRLWYWRPVSIR